MIQINERKAIELLRTAVRWNEKKVYQKPETDSDTRCVYQFDGEPSCLIGHALRRAGVTVESLRQMDESWESSIESVRIPGVSLTHAARQVFGAAQTQQDRGEPWGMALAEAESRLSDSDTTGRRSA